MVIRIELLNERRLHDLTTPVQMIFRVTAPRDMDVSLFMDAYFNILTIKLFYCQLQV